MMPEKIKIVVVDDHAVVREGIRIILDRDPAFAVVGEGATAESVTTLIADHRPDVVMLDVALPDGTGLEVIRRLRESGDRTAIIMLSVYDNVEYIVEAVRAGASGYLLKQCAPEELRAAVWAAYGGDAYFSPAVASQLARAVSPASRDDGPATTLTQRETEVLRLVAKGLTSKQAAARLGIGTRTVETHRRNAMQKLGVTNAADLVRYTVEHGLLDS